MFEMSRSAGEKSGLIRAPKTPKRLNAELMLFRNVPDSYPGISGVEFCIRITGFRDCSPRISISTHF